MSEGHALQSLSAAWEELNCANALSQAHAMMEQSALSTLARQQAEIAQSAMQTARHQAEMNMLAVVSANHLHTEMAQASAQAMSQYKVGAHIASLDIQALMSSTAMKSIAELDLSSIRNAVVHGQKLVSEQPTTTSLASATVAQGRLEENLSVLKKHQRLERKAASTIISFCDTGAFTVDELAPLVDLNSPPFAEGTMWADLLAELTARYARSAQDRAKLLAIYKALCETRQERDEVIQKLYRKLRNRKSDTPAYIAAVQIYCGLSWLKRAWFLLHGSHPPHTVTTTNLGFRYGSVYA